MNRNKIAIQVHIYYIDMANEIICKLNEMPDSFDLFITTDERYKKVYLDEIISSKCNADNVWIDIAENKGRDIKPFLDQMRSYINDYEYICHLHAKKTMANPKLGEEWKNYLFDKLIGSREIMQSILSTFDDNERIGIIYPDPFPKVKKWVNWAGNKDIALKLVKRMGISSEIPSEINSFPAGTMFWARTNAIKPFFELKLNDDEYPNELGQKNGTIMHAMERLFVYVAEKQGYETRVI